MGYLERFTPGRLYTTPGTVKLFKSPRQSQGFPFTVSRLQRLGQGLLPCPAGLPTHRFAQLAVVVAPGLGQEERWRCSSSLI